MQLQEAEKKLNSFLTHSIIGFVFLLDSKEWASFFLKQEKEKIIKHFLYKLGEFLERREQKKHHRKQNQKM